MSDVQTEEIVTEEVVEDVSRETGPSAEDEARNLGWRPESEYKGKPEDFISAKDFVERGKTIMPILQANNAQLQRQLTDALSDGKAREAYFEGEVASLKVRQRKELETVRTEAIQSGDLDKANAAQEELDAIPKVQETTDTSSTAVNQFITENDWYRSDRVMTLFADDESTRLANEFPGLTPEQNLQRVKSAVETQFPEKFSKRTTTMAPPSPVESGRKPPAKKTTNDYDSMPEDSRDACDELVGEGRVKQEDFVKNYYKFNPGD